MSNELPTHERYEKFLVAMETQARILGVLTQEDVDALAKIYDVPPPKVKPPPPPRQPPSGGGGRSRYADGFGGY